MVKKYQLVNDNISLTLLNVGATVYDCAIRLAEKWQSVTHHPESLTIYRNNPEYFGATVGPVANRIENGRFSVNEIEYQLDKNEGENHLHGGSDGLSFQFFQPIEQSATHLIFTLNTQHQYYPGRLNLFVSYFLLERGFRIQFDYQSSEDCPINLTNHTYFSLDPERGNVLGDKIAWQEAIIWYNNEQHIPQYSQPCQQNQWIIDQQLLNHYVQTRQPLIYSTYNKTLSMQVTTSYPGFMLYNSYYAGQTLFDNGHPLIPLSALCIEPQFIPNDINMQRNSLCKAGIPYQHWVEYQFIRHLG